MLCKILHAVYGRDTRSAQVVNILLSGIWAILLWLHSVGAIILDIPLVFRYDNSDVLVVAIMATMFSVLGVFTTGKRHQVLKFFGLSLGALFYGILANGYFSAYPPLEMMLVICLSLTIWFVGGLLYIVRCEGLDGKLSTEH